MNDLQNTSFKPSSEMIELKENLVAHIADGMRCDEFFMHYANPGWINSPHSLDLTQVQYAQSFSNAFCCISNNTPLQWQEKYKKISSSIEGKESIDLKSELDLCEKLNSDFCKSTISLIQNNAEALLSSQDKKGRIFFLPEMKPFIAIPYMEPSYGGIGECHCSPYLERKGRNSFSLDLIDQIAETFPEKKSVKIASIGAGACFHELEIHTLAHKRGYSISEWTLVDPSICEVTAANFQTLVKWASPETIVTSIYQEATPYFINLRNCSDKPDIFLFIDVIDIKESKIQKITKGMDHLYLSAYLSHKQRSITIHLPQTNCEGLPVSKKSHKLRNNKKGSSL